MKSDPYTLGSLNQISTLFTEPEKKNETKYLYDRRKVYTGHK